MRLAIVFSILFFILKSLFADSVLTIPVPDSVSKKDKNLKLSIRIPPKVDSKIKEVKLKEQKKIDYTYFDFDPINKKEFGEKFDFEIIEFFERKNLIPKPYDKLYKNYFTKIQFVYMIVKILHLITYEHTIDELKKLNITKDNIERFQKLVLSFKYEFDISNIDVSDYMPYLEKIKQELKYTGGEIEVIKIQRQDDGSSIIYLNLTEDR